MYSMVRCARLFVVAGTLFTYPIIGQAAVVTIGAVPNAPPGGGGAVVGAFSIGENGFGSVSVSGGTAITNTGGATIGNGVNGMGVVSLSGFGSDWTLAPAASDITLGDEGVGTLNVANQARVIVPDDTFIGALATGSGKLTVSNFGSLYSATDDFTVGVAGLGVVDVLNGGAIVSDALLVGDAASGRGFVTVSGELSRWNAGVVMLGDAGAGSLSIAEGGQMFSDAVVMAIVSTSTAIATVTGEASYWRVNGASTIGDGGTAHLQVLSGARVDFTNSLTLGAAALSRGELTVSGLGSRVTTVGGISTSLGDSRIRLADGGVLAIGSSSTIGANGRITLAGGRFEIASFTLIGVLEGSGTVQSATTTISATGPRGRLRTVTGNQLIVTGNVVNSGNIDQNGGQLEILGTLINNSDIDLRNGATLRVGSTGLDNNSGSQLAITSGVVDVFGAVDNNAGAEIAVVGGSTAVFHDAFTSAGTVFVSASSEIVLLENLGFVPASLLGVELAGSDQQSASGEDIPRTAALSVGGSAALAGSLAVSLGDDFAAVLGSTYSLISASGARTGTFSSVSLPTIGSGLALQLQYTSDSVLLAVVAAALLGDANNDGAVDVFDFDAVSQNFGMTGLPSTGLGLGDANDDGVVDVFDFDAVSQNFGNVAALDAASAGAVPEPASCVLAALALGLGFGLRRLVRN